MLNKGLWQALHKEYMVRKVSLEWVRGHDGHPENESADQLANRGLGAGESSSDTKTAGPTVAPIVESLKSELDIALLRIGLMVDPDRMTAWISDPNREPANQAFTKGPERQIAYAIEDLQRK